MILAIGDSHVISFHPRIVEFCYATMFPSVDATMPSDEGYGPSGGQPWKYTVGWVPIGDKP
jgi:hypothetical protein